MWGNNVEKERRNRIILSIYAYAYEFLDYPLVSDSLFDELSYKIDIDLQTGNEVMDDFFKKEFSPATGMWIRNHPELKRIKELYERYSRPQK